jgi:hypothetical protein
MKTIHSFLTTENNVQLLSVTELISVKGGDEPSVGADDPFKLPRPK